MRLVVGIAAFLAPVVLVLAAAAQAPGSDKVRTVLEQGATFLIDHVAHTASL